MASRKNNGTYTYLVSACLAGKDCTYRGKNNLSKTVKLLVDDHKAIPVCPEIMGGLKIPREMSEIVGGDGRKVLDKKARVLTASGKEITACYISGAKKALAEAKKYKIRKAILKSNSPSCGSGHIYDGTFRHLLMRGDGVLAALLKLNDIKVYTEKSKKH